VSHSAQKERQFIFSLDVEIDYVPILFPAFDWLADFWGSFPISDIPIAVEHV
jgi:hypothetical protein